MTVRKHIARILRKAAAKLDPRPPFWLSDFDRLPDTRAGGLTYKTGPSPRVLGPRYRRR